jgi:F-type H+-transporting ATPase subunit gamma
MRQLQAIQKEQSDMALIVQLTSTFESLASMQIARIKNEVLQAQGFFNELWHIYNQIRVDSLFRYGRKTSEKAIDKDLVIIISATGGFGGDIDQRVVATMLKQYSSSKQDIVVIGRHGTVLLRQAGIAFKKYFDLPQKDQNINVEPLVREIRQYRSTAVFYQTYISLMNQEIKRIELQTAIKELSEQAGSSDEIISEQTYIFEPSAFDVVAHLERSMLRIALSQVILDSKLAQYASRFRAMTMANERSKEGLTDLTLLYSRTKRAQRDERLKQMISGLKATRKL